LIKQKVDIDIWGRGSHLYKGGKGNFKNTEPYEDYKFTIAIENMPSNEYITEKYANPIIYNCVPIYYGAKNVEKYFGKKCCYKLTENLRKDVQLIKNISKNPDKYLLDLSTARYHKFDENGNANFMNFINRRWN
jgi:hypothetical protein